jgi:uncharacterized protein YndB with AHSA1/START domain
MELLASARVVVDCTREQVFRFAADLAHFPEWFPGVVAVRPLDAAPAATVGKRYGETLALPFGRTRQVTIEVVEAQPDRRLVTQAAFPLLLPRMEMGFEDADGGACLLEWRMFSRNTATLPRWTVVPLARRTLQRRADMAMGRLRQLLGQRA